MVRRLLLLVPMMLLLWGGPAHAQTYGEILSDDQTQGGSGVVITPAGRAPAAVLGRDASRSVTPSRAPGNLAQTGKDNIVPLLQVAIGLLGAGTLLVLATRRRRQAPLSTV